MTNRTRAAIARVFASAVLAAFTLSVVAPSMEAASVSRECPFAPGSGAIAPAVVSATPDGACGHTVAGPCLAALGCLTTAPAITLVPTLLVISNSLIVLPPCPAPYFGDLFRTSPPTPPPNLI